MRNYEVTFIVDPVLSGDEIKATAQTYVDRLQAEGCSIVHVDEMGLRALAYPINRRSSGVYFCVEFQTESAEFLTAFELFLKRDERILRFLTVQLDKYGIKYNDDKRKGLIGSKKKKHPERVVAETAAPAKAEAPAAKAEAPAVVEAPVAEPVVEAVAEPVVETVVETTEAVVEEVVAETTEVVAEATEEVTEAVAEPVEEAVEAVAEATEEAADATEPEEEQA